ncbi:MAG: hypothetical protein IKT98_02305 [Selenomonadaceae bacterium]|nr:hypothetical protein [Selenomonadaceae bacterium]
MNKKIFHCGLLIMLCALIFTGCLNDDKPEKALNDIKIALNAKSLMKLSDRVNPDEFFSDTYEAVTIELAKKYDVYKENYPNDQYFQHNAEFLVAYNMENKNLHLKFLNDVKDAFFARTPEPATPKENPAAYVANEFEKIRQATTAKITKTRIEGNKSAITLELTGDDSLQGKFIGQITLELEFFKDARNNWRFEKIRNLDELTPILVDKIEPLWINP